VRTPPARRVAAREHPVGASQGDPEAFDRDVFLLRERVFTIRSKYEVWAEDGTAILYVERPTYPLRTLVAYLAGLVAGSWCSPGWGTLPRPPVRSSVRC